MSGDGGALFTGRSSGLVVELELWRVGWGCWWGLATGVKLCMRSSPGSADDKSLSVTNLAPYTGPPGEEAEESLLACRSLLFRSQSLAAALPRVESRRLTVELSGCYFKLVDLRIANLKSNISIASLP
jgi:hypothetical protein